MTTRKVLVNVKSELPIRLEIHHQDGAQSASDMAVHEARELISLLARAIWLAGRQGLRFGEKSAKVVDMRRDDATSKSGKN